MSELKHETFKDLYAHINVKLAIKGTIYAGLLMVGTLLGALMRSQGVQGYIIWGVVATINVVATILVFKALKHDLKTPEEKKAGKKVGKSEETEQSATSSQYATESDK